MSIKCIIFDYDGVIVDSFDEMHAVYQILCKELGYDCPTDREVFRNSYGRDYRDLYVSLGVPENLWEKGSEIYYREIIKRDSKPFSLIKSQLELLAEKYLLYVVSATSQVEVETKLERHHLRSYFKDIYAQKKVNDNFSKVKSINHILNTENINTDEVIHIGDRNKDYERSIEAGLKNIIILNYGWGNTITPDQAMKVDKQEDLLKVIEQFS